MAFAKLQFLRVAIQCILQVLIDCSTAEEDISTQSRHILFSKMIKFDSLNFLESINSVLQSLMLTVAIEPKGYSLLAPWQFKEQLTLYLDRFEIVQNEWDEGTHHISEEKWIFFIETIYKLINYFEDVNIEDVEIDNSEIIVWEGEEYFLNFEEFRRYNLF